MEAILPSETSVLTRPTRRHIPEDGSLHSQRRACLFTEPARCRSQPYAQRSFGLISDAFQRNEQQCRYQTLSYQPALSTEAAMFPLIMSCIVTTACLPEMGHISSCLRKSTSKERYNTPFLTFPYVKTTQL
jgi:hypothetical protein